MRLRQTVKSVPDPGHLQSANVGATLEGVVVTSWTVPDQSGRAQRLGAVAVATNPYDVTALRDTVLAALVSFERCFGSIICRL